MDSPEKADTTNTRIAANTGAPTPDPSPDPARMRAVLREELKALEIWAAVPSLPEDVADGIQISIDKIRRVLGKHTRTQSAETCPAPHQTGSEMQPRKQNRMQQRKPHGGNAR